MIFVGIFELGCLSGLLLGMMRLWGMTGVIVGKRVSPRIVNSGGLGPLELLFVEGMKFEIDVESVRQ